MQCPNITPSVARECFLCFLLFRLLVGLVLLQATMLQAATAIPTEMTYQGQLMDSSGQPMPGPVGGLHFDFYENAAGGSPVWSEIHTNVALDTQGRFVARIGSVNTSGLDILFFNNNALWLEITVDGDTLTPRQPMASVGYALRSASTDWTGLTNIPADLQDGDQYKLAGVGLNSSGALNNVLDISTSYRVPQGCVHDNIARWDNAQGAWVCDTETVTTPTIYSAGTGLRLVTGNVFEVAFQGAGSVLGTSGFVARSDHTHAEQIWTATGGTGLSVTTSDNQAGTSGLEGVSSSGATYGVEGRTTSNSDGAAGVHGVAEATTGLVYGVYGKAASPSGYGVYSEGNSKAEGNAEVTGNLTVGGTLNVTNIGTGSGNLSVGNMHIGGIANVPYLGHSEFDETRTSHARYPSVAIGTDGLPVIAFWDPQLEGDEMPGAVWIVRCKNTHCSQRDLHLIDDTIGNYADSDDLSRGARTTIAIGQDGFPVIAYLVPDRSIRVAHCSNRDCSHSTWRTIVGPGEGDGQVELGSLSMAVGPNGPVTGFHAHLEGTGPALWVAECSTPTCSSPTVTRLMDTTSWADQMVIGSDGKPVFLVKGGASPGTQFWVLHCSSGSCSDLPANILTKISDCALCGLNDHINPMLVIGANGAPLAAWQKSGTEFTFAVCEVPDCSSYSTHVASLNPMNPAIGRPETMVVDQSGRPSFVLASNLGWPAPVTYYFCSDFTCSSLLEAPQQPVFGWFGVASLTFGADGLPFLVDDRGGEGGSYLKITHCADRFCSRATRRR